MSSYYRYHNKGGTEYGPDTVSWLPSAFPKDKNKLRSI